MMKNNPHSLGYAFASSLFVLFVLAILPGCRKEDPFCRMDCEEQSKACRSEWYRAQSLCALRQQFAEREAIASCVERKVKDKCTQITCPTGAPCPEADLAGCMLPMGTDPSVSHPTEYAACKSGGLSVPAPDCSDLTAKVQSPDSCTRERAACEHVCQLMAPRRLF